MGVRCMEERVVVTGLYDGGGGRGKCASNTGLV